MILPDEAATKRVGEILARAIQPGTTIALIGDLGAGKTTLVTGLVGALGGTASSPTFSLVNEYPTRRFVVWHIDLYRLELVHEGDTRRLTATGTGPRGELLASTLEGELLGSEA